MLPRLSRRRVMLSCRCCQRRKHWPMLAVAVRVVAWSQHARRLMLRDGR